MKLSAFVDRAVLLLALCLSSASAAHAQESQWVWSPAQQSDAVPEGSCYFRKTFEMNRPESGEIHITCDDAYELYVNGRQVATGENWRVLDVYDITDQLQAGKNTVAVKATNSEGDNAGLAIRVIVKNQGGTHVVHASDATWKSSVKELPHWNKSQFNDAQWVPARVIGPFNKTKPWFDQVQSASGAGSRFQVNREFQVETVLTGADTGSLIAMTFDEFGNILAAPEKGPLLLIRDTDKDGKLDTASPYCELVEHVQGILALNGNAFVVGDGSEGTGLYRLSDEDGDGRPDHASQLLAFNGKMGEHGPHSPVLGPDGLIYVMLGNHSSVGREAEPTSPYRNAYEGDLVGPRYEEPSGHAAGIKAPGGHVVRTDVDGSFVEVFAGGLRNAYDMSFDGYGELLTSDSDMEWDMGTTWYRPTRVNHLTAGSEYGWRSGWSVWPDYYIDGLPATIDTGRGSPAGMVVYDHVMYPARFHNTLFVGDWSRGQIRAIRMRPSGGSYVAESEVFVAGKPLNVTDLQVGPDGALYFCTGGRDTEGGIYRVTWKGRVPPSVTELGKGLDAAIRQPQLNSAFARQRVALVKQQLGERWDELLPALAVDAQATPEQRARALELMQLLGPFPTSDVLAKASEDSHPIVRAKAAYLMGIHADEETRVRLLVLLKDKDLRVARVACESLARAGQTAPLQSLAPLLASTDRHTAFAARRLLEQLPVERWRTPVLGVASHRIFMQGATALLAVDPTPETAQAVLARCQAIMDGFVTDENFLDLLRVMQLAFHRGNLTGDDVPELSAKLANEYPSADPLINRELVRLLAHVNEPSVRDRMLAELRGKAAMPEKVNVAMYARFIDGWTSEQKFQLLKFYEQARSQPDAGHSFAGYIENVSRDFFAGLTPEERTQVLKRGAQWPSSALSVLAKLPANPGEETIRQIIELDKQLIGDKSEAAARLGIGVIAVLGRSGDEQAMAHLREVFETQPARRNYVAIGLAQSPGGENWPLLVQSLVSIEGAMAQEVLIKLRTVDDAPEQPSALRNVILAGLRLGNGGGAHAVALLEKWTETKVSEPGDKPDVAIAAWQQWFAETFPEEPAATLPVDTASSKWTYDELHAYLVGPQAHQGDALRGAAVFNKAQCSKCHRYGDRGETLGPDLTTVSSRFQQKEILESILFPSHVISDQYASKNVLTTDGKTFTGIVGPAASDGTLTVLGTDGEKITLQRDEVEEISPSKKSAMPDGLLNSLTLEEVADLFTFLNQPPRTNISSRREPLR